MADSDKQRFERQLDLILMMIDGCGHTSTELSKVLGTTLRNLYYFFEQLRQCGFRVVRKGRYYYIDPRSDFFRQIASGVTFSDDEAAYLYKLVDTVKSRNKYTEAVSNKLLRFYDIAYMADRNRRNQTAQNISRLYDAMDRKRAVILHNYSSPHSQTVSDRLVEPFMFMNDQSDLRCYELASHTNKTFKLARIGEVRIVEELTWNNEPMHKPVFTDLFLFSGEERHHVTLRLGQLARNLLSEEYPQADRYIREDQPRQWIFEADVASYMGIGRFILGLAEDIEILGDEGLRQYLRERVRKIKF